MMINALLNFLKPGKKKPERLTYEDFIINNARSNTSFNITAVNDIVIIKTLPANEEVYAEIATLIKDGKIDSLESLTTGGHLLEELTLVKFTNQAGEPYAAVVFDGYDAWGTPVVIDIFKL